MFPHPIIKNLSNRVIYEVARFVKRDYLELRFMKDPIKIKAFFDTSISRNAYRMQRQLLEYNRTYGIIVGNTILVESEEKCYWKIDPVDSYENFANNISYWGVSLSLINKKTTPKVISISYYMPFLEEYFYCTEENGCFQDERKLSLIDSSKILIGTGTNKIEERKFGSDILTVLYCACEKINVAILKRTEFNEALVDLVMKETRGSVKKTADKVIFGNRNAVNTIALVQK